LEQNKEMVVSDRDGLKIDCDWGVPVTAITEGRLYAKKGVDIISSMAKNNEKFDKRNNRYSMSETDRFNKTLNTIKSICDLAGYTIDDRIVLRDQKTGRVWR